MNVYIYDDQLYISLKKYLYIPSSGGIDSHGERGRMDESALPNNGRTRCGRCQWNPRRDEKVLQGQETASQDEEFSETLWKNEQIHMVNKYNSGDKTT